MGTPELAPEHIVYIVILNWNAWQDTAECVQSCRKLSYPSFRLLIVDNGSTDGSEAALRGQFPDIEFIQTGSNLGFTGGNNAGMRHALQKGADYIILLNNDTTVDREFVTALVAAAETDRSIGMLCSKIYFYDRPDVLWYAGASFHPWLGWGRHRGYNVPDRGQYDTVEETPRPTGCSLMVTRQLCESVGLLREEFFCYAEDIDWGMRAANHNMKIMYVPSSRVWHKVSLSTGGQASGVSLYYSTRNILSCLDTNRPLPFPLRHMRYIAVLTAAMISLFTQKVQRAAGLKYIVRGAIHYFQGRFGPLVATDHEMRAVKLLGMNKKGNK